jgi:hypothetical protein
MSTLSAWVRGFASSPNDSSEEAFTKSLIATIAASCCAFALIWSGTYFVIFGRGLIAVLPLSYIVVVGGAIGIAHRLRDHRVLVYAHIFCITWLPALVQWSIGSMDQAGLLIAWSFLGPLASLIFLSFRQAIGMMVVFLIIVVISAAIDPQLLGESMVVSHSVHVLFYFMNLGVSLTMVFAVSAWFVVTARRERGLSETLLGKVRMLFGRHVSREVADELISSESMSRESKSYHATIMFLDIRSVFNTSSQGHALQCRKRTGNDLGLRLLFPKQTGPRRNPQGSHGATAPARLDAIRSPAALLLPGHGPANHDVVQDIAETAQ